MGFVKVGSGEKENKVLLLAETLPNFLNKRSGELCCLILLNPIHISDRPNRDKRQKRITPITSTLEPWLWWLNYQRSQLREYCNRLACGNKSEEQMVINIFQSIIRLLSLSDLITYTNAGLLAYRENEKGQKEWIKNQVLKFIGPLDQEECWHNCLNDPWPPCHEGAQSDRELALILLEFCPWTSNVKNKCNSVPKRLTGNWHNTVCNRLWGLSSKLVVDGIHVNRNMSSMGVEPSSLDEKSLTRLFVAEYLGSGKHSKYFKSNTVSIGHEERARCLGHIGRVLHHLLGPVPLDWRTIESLVWMIAEYGHNHLKIDSRLDIASHLLHAARIEPALHAMQEFYRDHFFHAIEVCFLGHLLLLTSDKSGKCLWEYFAEQLKSSTPSGGPGQSDPNGSSDTLTLEDILRQWYITALFHDVGYTIQVFRALQGMLDFHHHPSQIKEFREHLNESLNKLSESILTSPLASILELKKDNNKIGIDHGVIAAVHLEGLLRELNRDKYAGDYQLAIQAIGVHNNHQVIVDFTTNPFGFLLILCDTIQEWNRPHLRHATAPSMLLARLLEANENMNTTGPLDVVSLNVSRSGKSKTRPNFLIAPDEPENILKVNLTYSEQIQENSGVFNLWIDSSYNLQRLRFGNFPLNIELSFYTPFFRLLGCPQQSQMQRLYDARKDTHMDFLEYWLPSVDGNNATGAVRYSQVTCSKSSKYDVLTLDLRRLTETKTILSDIDEFRHLLGTWKRRNEDRDVEGDYTRRVPGQ